MGEKYSSSGLHKELIQLGSPFFEENEDPKQTIFVITENNGTVGDDQAELRERTSASSDSSPFMPKEI